MFVQQATQDQSLILSCLTKATGKYASTLNSAGKDPPQSLGIETLLEFFPLQDFPKSHATNYPLEKPICPHQP